MNFKVLPKNKISRLPETPGVYAFMKGRKFLYIGKAVNLRSRVRNHRGESVFSLGGTHCLRSNKIRIWCFASGSKTIKEYQPKYNVSWKDDKNYFYVGVTEEKFPQVFITHQPKCDETFSSQKLWREAFSLHRAFVSGKL